MSYSITKADIRVIVKRMQDRILIVGNAHKDARDSDEIKVAKAIGKHMEDLIAINCELRRLTK